MRKAILNLIVGTIVLMFVSCSADEPIAINTLDGAISYTVVAANQTRAAHLSYCNQHKPDKFKVWAIHNENNSLYIEGKEAQQQGETYAHEDAIYWPDNGSLSFYAIIDGAISNNLETGSFSRTNTSAQINNYQIPEETEQQLDLMYAVRKDQYYESNKNNNVKLIFRHALSQICFQAENENSLSKIFIHSISVNNVCSKGTYHLPTGNTDGNYDTHTSRDETTTGFGNWNSLEEKVSYVIDFDKAPELTTEKTIVNLTNYDNHSKTTRATDENDENYTKVLNLLPQESKGSVSFTLNLTVKNKTNDQPTKYNKVDIEIPVDIDWKEGTRYIYTFHFLKDWDPNNHSIKYDVEISDFNNEEPAAINIINEHEAVLMKKGENNEPDLYFATTNIGATSPYDTGLYFWWGDTIGYAKEDAPERTSPYDWDKSVRPIVYHDLDELKKSGILTEDDFLAPIRDAATHKWAGPWRMPTREELDWLKNENNCDWVSETINIGTITVKGYKVTSISTNNSIFLPVTSYIEAGADTNYKKGWVTEGSMPITGYYWSSTPSERKGKAYRLKFDKQHEEVLGEGNRCDGFVIRPVANPIDIPNTDESN